MKVNLKDFTYQELENFVAGAGEAKFRAKQIYSWLYKGVESFDEMTNLSKELRQKLSEISYVSSLKILKKLVSSIDGTTKFLFELEDKNTIESVVMFYKHGASICISSQVGCRMGCKFCASTIGGLVRNLTAGEIIDQIIFAQKELNIRISNVVIMGIGEPMDNFDNIIKFLSNVSNDNGINIGMRHITLSTCGVVPGILKLAEKNLQLTLSISLHAPNDEIRNSMMPISRKYSYNELLSACKKYLELTNRRITFEYTLVSGVNDKRENALELSEKLRGMLCHINLIPVNEIGENNYKRSEAKSIENFKTILENKGFAVTVRRELGSDIKASCGQLRQKGV